MYTAAMINESTKCDYTVGFHSEFENECRSSMHDLKLPTMTGVDLDYGLIKDVQLVGIVQN